MGKYDILYKLMEYKNCFLLKTNVIVEYPVDSF